MDNMKTKREKHIELITDQVGFLSTTLEKLNESSEKFYNTIYGYITKDEDDVDEIIIYERISNFIIRMESDLIGIGLGGNGETIEEMVCGRRLDGIGDEKTPTQVGK